MKNTFRELEKHLEEANPHKITDGRKTGYIPDVIDKGWSMLSTIEKGMEDNEDEDDTEAETRVDLEDIVVELF